MRLSSNGNSGKFNMKNKRSNTRKWKLWAGFIVVIFAVWFSVWFLLAHFGDGFIDDAIAKLKLRGFDVACENRAIKGFPFRLGVFCSRVNINNLRTNVQMEAGALRSTALLFKPDHVIIEFDAPGFVSMNGSIPTALHWSNLRASIEGGLEGLERLSPTINGFELQFPQSIGSIFDGFELKRGEFHVRPTPQNKASDFDVALSMESANIVSVQNFLSGKWSSRADFQISKSISRYLPGLNRHTLNSHDQVKGRLRSWLLTPSSGGTIRLAGPFTIDDRGLINGKFRLAMADLGQLGKTLLRQRPEFSGALKPVVAAIKSLGKPTEINDKPAREITIKVKQGRVFLGFIVLGRIPPLQDRQSGF